MKNHKIKIKDCLKIAVTAFKRWRNKDPFMQSAVIAYYAIFSMPGLLVLVISFAAIFFERDAITGHVYEQVSKTMGHETAIEVQNMILTVAKANNSFVATLIGIITILIGASAVFAQLQKALNNIWEVQPKLRRRFSRLLRRRLFSFGLILTVGFLLLISLTLTTLLAALSDWATSNWPSATVIILLALNFIISFTVVMILFALMFKILPDAKVEWGHVWLGSILTALLFILGKSAIGFYLSKTDPGSAYGAAGSVILILLWVSYSSMIFFYGAEFTKSYADHYTGTVMPTENAIPEKSPKAKVNL